MLFQHTIEMVLNQTKSQTRRLVKPDDRFTMALAVVAVGYDAGRVIQTVPTSVRALSKGSCVHAVWSGKRVKYRVGQTLAVQPGRTAKGIARIRITGIKQEDVRSISDEDVKAEGFKSKWDFLMTWVSMHDKSVYQQMVDWNGYTDALFRFCAREPADRYQVWCLTFELVTSAVAE